MIRKELERCWRPGALTGRIFSQLHAAGYSRIGVLILDSAVVTAGL
jgi:hypothetical protein